MLAGARAGDRRNVLRPAPARLEHEAATGRLVEVDDVDSAGREPADLIGRREALPLQARHAAESAPTQDRSQPAAPALAPQRLRLDNPRRTPWSGKCLRTCSSRRRSTT